MLPAIVAISGASGLIGSALARDLTASGIQVRRLVRRSARRDGEIGWDPRGGTIDTARLEGVHAVVHLAGENIAQRWSSGVRTRIRASRVEGTRLLAETIASLATPPSVFLSGSATGYYGDRGDELLDEQSTSGTGFLASVSREWEAAAEPAERAGVRTVRMRMGVVLDRHEGALPRMLLPFQLGLGGRVGDGRQWLSWIALADAVAALRFLLDAPVRQPANIVAPEPVTNAEFAETLGDVLGRPSLVPVPAFALTLAYGDMARETLLASQRVRPATLLAAGHTFTFPTLAGALRSVLDR